MKRIPRAYFEINCQCPHCKKPFKVVEQIYGDGKKEIVEGYTLARGVKK